MRPVKLSMYATKSKDLIMSRLVNLENAEEQFKAVSVRDDYTIKERELINSAMKRQTKETETKIATCGRYEAIQKTD